MASLILLDLLRTFENFLLLGITGNIKSKLCFVLGEGMTFLIDTDFAANNWAGNIKQLRQISQFESKTHCLPVTRLHLWLLLKELLDGR